MNGADALSSAIRAGEIRMDAAAANIARLGVGGTAPFRVQLSAAPSATGGGVEARVEVDPSGERSLAREAVELLAAARETAIAIRAARRADDAGESVLDILA
jgi:hypothetical protein